ncbi:MAG: BatD family protein [Bacteroidota bacterium]|nr:BatD family protein [Bacteroidota bacterium]
MIKLWLFFIAMSFHSLHSQDLKFIVDLDKDSLLLGNYLEITFTIENGNGKFFAPEFSGFGLLGPASQFSSYSNINGMISQRQSYQFTLKPEREGSFLIPTAEFISDGTTFTTPEININVLPNPEGLIQNSKRNLRSDFVPTPGNPSIQHKKRKVIKI